MVINAVAYSGGINSMPFGRGKSAAGVSVGIDLLRYRSGTDVEVDADPSR